MSRADSQSDIRAVLARQEADWNRGDLESFMSGYLNSPDIVFVGSSITRGWQATLERYRKSYPNKERMGTLRFAILNVTPLGSNHALVLGEFHLDRTAAGGGPANGRFTLTFQKTKAGWKVIADHTSS